MQPTAIEKAEAKAATRTLLVYLDRGPMLTIADVPESDATFYAAHFANWADGHGEGSTNVIDQAGEHGRRYVIPFGAIQALVIA